MRYNKAPPTHLKHHGATSIRLCFIPIQTDRGKQGRHKNYCRKIFSRRQRDKSETKMHKTDGCMKWRIDHDIPLIANDLRERNPNKIRKLNYFVSLLVENLQRNKIIVEGDPENLFLGERDTDRRQNINITLMTGSKNFGQNARKWKWIRESDSLWWNRQQWTFCSFWYFDSKVLVVQMKINQIQKDSL